ncbi:S-layer homology domain-containing protein [Clostridium thermosuccinogenes]|uniref:S-layer homology domain-containing protein n=1 Tax=Clostridium thermosuccinogenes TaxID=84032 RepID=UPI00137A9215|nr:S-layer homology domain-containing protein [Pseudoclostridium thermosuccinogenes]
MRKKAKYLFKVMALIMILSMILPVGFSVSQTKVFASTPVYFTDVKETDWFYKDVMELTKRGLISGYSNKTFKPSTQIRVDEFIKILVSAIDENIKPSQSNYWADSYINRAKELGIVQDGEFSSYTRNITRGEMARMIVRAGTGTSAKGKGFSLDIPENYKEYSYLITDYSTLDPDSKDIALKVFVSGIITGSSDGSLNFNKNATRAEVCAILMRFLEKDQRKIPELPVDFNNTLTVKEFTTQLLKALGKEANMDYALKMGYVRPSAEYPSYNKPILKREATLTMARIMDELTGVTALFTSGDNDLFIKGYTRNHRLQPYQIDKLINNTGREYFALVEWENYRGHIKDIRMITPDYQKEMITLYLAGIIDANENKELRPYDFLTKEEAQKWINNIKGYSLLSSDEVISKLAKNIRNLEEKPMPEVEKPSNAELWRSPSPYVNKRLYEYPLKLDRTSGWGQAVNAYNIELESSTLKLFKPMYELYFNTRYTVDYRNLDAEAKYYTNYGGKWGIGNYEKRVLFYHNPAQSTNGYLDENGNDKKFEDIILPDKMLKIEIEKYKKYKVVSQAELITDNSLIFSGGDMRARATWRIIYYPPTDPAFLKEQGLEVGKWYEKDILIDMGICSDGPEELRDRWEFSALNYSGYYDFGPYRPMEYLK